MPVACCGRTAAVLYTGAGETQLYARRKYVASTEYLTRAHPSASSPRKKVLATKLSFLFHAKNRTGHKSQTSIKVSQLIPLPHSTRNIIFKILRKLFHIWFITHYPFN